MHVIVIHHNLTERCPHCGHFEYLLNSKTEHKTTLQLKNLLVSVTLEVFWKIVSSTANG